MTAVLIVDLVAIAIANTCVGYSYKSFSGTPVDGLSKIRNMFNHRYFYKASMV